MEACTIMALHRTFGSIRASTGRQISTLSSKIGENRLSPVKLGLAVAVVAKAEILNATDSDWEEQKALISNLGVSVRQLCPQHASKSASQS